jgi:hypothetical protein
MPSEQPRPSERKDILAISAKAEDSQIAYLVSAIEAAQKLQQAAVFNHDTADEQVERISIQSQVGTLIIVPSGMDAMDIANKAGLLLGGQGATMPLDVKLLIDGQKEHVQREEWAKGGRDVVIATPDRLRYLLMTEPSMREAFRYTQLVTFCPVLYSLADHSLVDTRPNKLTDGKKPSRRCRCNCKLSPKESTSSDVHLYRGNVFCNKATIN